MANKRNFSIVIPGNTYAIPEYEVIPNVGIQETGNSVIMSFARGSKIASENTESTGPHRGSLQEHYLSVLIYDLKRKAEEFPSRETSLAITNLEQALHWLEEREHNRAAQGVLGTYKNHKS